MLHYTGRNIIAFGFFLADYNVYLRGIVRQIVVLSTKPKHIHV